MVHQHGRQHGKALLTSILLLLNSFNFKGATECTLLGSYTSNNYVEWTYKRCNLHSKAQSINILKKVFLRHSYYYRLIGRQCYTYRMGLEVPVLMVVVE